MKIYINSLFLVLGFTFTNCDPGLRGDLKIYNETDQLLTAKYFDFSTSDTTFKDIHPRTFETIKVLGGLGDKSEFDCCPCQFQYISIQSSLGQIKKDVSNGNNWHIPNKGKLKKFGKEPVKCELHILQHDL